MANSNNTSVVFTMKFDPADLAKLSSQINAAMGGRPATGGSPAPSGVTSAGGGSGNSGSNIFVQMFKSLLALEGIKQLLGIISRNSTVANGYFSAMGKLFGAAIDMLLIPFTPILDLLLVGMSKLIDWLSRDDVQKVLSNIAKFLIDSFKNFVSDVKNLYEKMKPALESIAKAGASVLDVANKILDKLGLGGKGGTVQKYGMDAIFGLIGVNLVAGVLGIVNKMLLGVPGKIGGAGASAAAGALGTTAGVTIAGLGLGAAGIAGSIATLDKESGGSFFHPKTWGKYLDNKNAIWNNPSGWFHHVGNASGAPFRALGLAAPLPNEKGGGAAGGSVGDLAKSFQQTVHINIYESKNPKDTVDLVIKELAKAGGYATRR